MFFLITFSVSSLPQGRGLMDMPVLDQAPEILRTLHYLSSLVHSLKNPVGTRDHPARLCKDLHNCQNTLYDGVCAINFLILFFIMITTVIFVEPVQGLCGKCLCVWCF